MGGRKKHENCVRFCAFGEIIARKKIAENPHHTIHTTVMGIKCCNKNKKLNDCSTKRIKKNKNKKLKINRKWIIKLKKIAP